MRSYGPTNNVRVGRPLPHRARRHAPQLQIALSTTGDCPWPRSSALHGARGRPRLGRPNKRSRKGTSSAAPSGIQLRVKLACSMATIQPPTDTAIQSQDRIITNEVIETARSTLVTAPISTIRSTPSTVEDHIVGPRRGR